MCFWAVSVNAQELQSLRGKVLNHNEEIVTGAVVSCMDLSDSTIVAYCVTAEDGTFQIQGLNESYEKYLLEISLLGYEKAYEKPSSGDLVVILKEAAFSLDEVVVTAYSQRLQQKPGKFIYTPSVSETGNIDSYDMLRYTPLIALEGDIVSILGKGTSSIYINGRKPLMNNTSLMEMLRSIPASQIENIEIITSPNSSHKASTIGGIVNIVMKKNPNQGLTGSMSLSGTYLAEKVSPRVSLYMAYSKNRFNASGNLSYRYYNTQNETDVLYNYKDSFTDIINSTNQETRGNLLNANINLTYDCSKLITIGSSFHLGTSNTKIYSTTNSLRYLNDIINEYSRTSNETINPFSEPEISIVGFYNHKIDDKGSNLDISVNYSSSFNTSIGNMEYASGTNVSSLIPYSIFQQNTTVDTYGYEFKATYTHNFEEYGVLEFGYEFNASHLSDDFTYNDFDGIEYVKDEDSSSNFNYDEKIHAFYMTYDKEWGEVLSTSVGLRAENTKIVGTTLQDEFSQNYLNLFPVASVLLDLADGDHSIALDFSRSILRPFYNDLNPFKIWTSENTYTMGNIYLEPMIYNDLDLSYSVMGDYIIGVCYSYASDAFSEYSFVAENNTTVSSVTNFGNEQNLSMYFNMNKLFFKGIWRMSLSAGLDYDITEGSIDAQDISYTSWMGMAGIRNVFRISQKRGIRATMSYNYSTPSRGILKIGRHKHLLNLYFTKEFKFGGNLALEALNLLNYKPSYYYSTDVYSYDSTPKSSNISIQLRYTQKFGQNRVRGAKDRSETKHIGRFRSE